MHLNKEKYKKAVKRSPWASWETTPTLGLYMDENGGRKILPNLIGVGGRKILPNLVGVGGRKILPNLVGVGGRKILYTWS